MVIACGSMVTVTVFAGPQPGFVTRDDRPAAMAPGTRANPNGLYIVSRWRGGV